MIKVGYMGWTWKRLENIYDPEGRNWLTEKYKDNEELKKDILSYTDASYLCGMADCRKSIKKGVIIGSLIGIGISAPIILVAKVYKFKKSHAKKEEQ